MFIVISVIFLLVIIFYLSARSFGNKKYKEAKSLEEQKKYKEACYFYAVAVLNGFKIEDCRERIKDIWKQYGPFDYTDIKEQIIAQGIKDYGDDIAGHAVTMSIIEEVITGKKKIVVRHDQKNNFTQP